MEAGIIPFPSWADLEQRMSELTRDGAAELVSRYQIIKLERGCIPSSADHGEDCQPSPFELLVMKYIHNYTQCIKSWSVRIGERSRHRLLRTGPGFVYLVQVQYMRASRRLYAGGQILFAGFVAGMEDTRLPKYVMFVELVGARGLREGAGKRVNGVFPG